MSETFWQVLALVLPLALVVGCNWWAWRRRTYYEEYRSRNPIRESPFSANNIQQQRAPATNDIRSEVK